MAVSLHDISRRLDIPPDELMKQSLLSFVDREIRLAEWDISDIKDRYSVSSRSELEAGIKAKTIRSHPAWEDLIHWESLEAYVQNLRSLKAELCHAA